MHVSLHILTFQMYVGHLVPGPLLVIYPFHWLRQVLETRHSLFRSDEHPLAAAIIPCLGGAN
jgi:hypothetical protein